MSGYRPAALIPRGRCSVCGNLFRQRVDGTMRIHERMVYSQRDSDHWEHCPGSLRPPEEDR